ncbi:MAG: membrane protein insertase YidC [Paludibacteraceae bacterium]|nr:membrane protein insertase YidC [Paludibacteraceae bacterium]
MDKNTWIGFGLIAAIIIGFSFINRPSKEELAERQRIQDSIAVVRAMEQEAQMLSQQLTEDLISENGNVKGENEVASAEALAEQVAAVYGPFAPAAQGEEGLITLENEKVRLGIARRGGRIAKAELKEYKAYGDSVNDLCLFQGDESSLNFTLVTNNSRILSTQNMYFQEESLTTDDEGKSTLVMRLNTNIDGCYIDFVYTLPADDYMVGMSIQPHNMQLALAQNMSSIELQWNQTIPQQEKGRNFEEKYAQLQYMFVGGDIEKLSEVKADRAKESARLKWIAYKDQFFSTVLIADDAFESTQMESTPLNALSRYIKEYNTTTSLPLDITGKKTTDLHYYLGPNHYNTLKAYDKDVEKADRLHLNELVPLGWKIVSWINKALVIPMFNLFTSWGLHIGIVILLMTLVIKLIILPFVFASYKSSAKMRVLKPQLDEINAKYPPEKMQERQQATMALYQKAGVSPMSGCLPMLFQFPVLMAMFWFLPTAIELRGQSLFWADDLSTYDAIITWSKSIPIFGTHLSLFCLLMTIVNIVYTHITMQTQSGGQEMKVMKWMMYLMPLMFLFIFNDYAAGLSYYYLVSLLMTIIQTMIFRWAIDDKKVLAQMEANAKKKGTQKKSGFAARLEAMQREQQRLAREQAKAQMRR